MMITSESKNEMEVMVLTDLAALYNKLAQSSALREEQRVKARQFVAEFNSLVPYRGEDNASKHYEGETLLQRMARFLPNVID
jgi:hypothetical protein